MMGHLIKICVLVCFLACYLNSAAASPAPPEIISFVFSQQWPAAFCGTDQGCCAKPGHPIPDDRFTVHGLWPNVKEFESNDVALGKGEGRGKHYDCDVKDYPFDPKAISDLVPTLEMYWESLSCRMTDNYEFWKHEWVKHGACARATFPNERSYFQSVLQLYEQVDVMGALATAGIAPTMDELVYTDDVIAAISDGLGVRAQLRCTWNEDAGTEQLSEVRICVAPNGQRLIDCEERSECKREILFPTLAKQPKNNSKLRGAAGVRAHATSAMLKEQHDVEVATQ